MARGNRQRREIAPDDGRGSCEGDETEETGEDRRKEGAA